MARGPGSQRRRNARWYAGGVGIMAVFALMMVGFAAYGASSPGKAPRWVFIAVFGGAALVLALLAWWLWLRRRSRAARHFSVQATPLVHRGGDVDAVLRVTGPVSGRLQVGLVCRERYDVLETRVDGDGNTFRDRVTREARAHEDWREAGPLPGEQRFRFAVPAGAPFSHEGDAVSWIWAVVAREDQPRRRDPTAEAPVWVAP